MAVERHRRAAGARTNVKAAQVIICGTAIGIRPNPAVEEIQSSAHGDVFTYHLLTRDIQHQPMLLVIREVEVAMGIIV